MGYLLRTISSNFKANEHEASIRSLSVDRIVSASFIVQQTTFRMYQIYEFLYAQHHICLVFLYIILRDFICWFLLSMLLFVVVVVVVVFVMTLS
jgi:hypothetical protein